MGTFLQVLFWTGIFIVFYTYIGYGILLFILTKIKAGLKKEASFSPFNELPEVTLVIAAYNEESVVDSKMNNCRELDYPQGRLHLVWITDGSTDRTNEKLNTYPEVTLYYQPERKGKTAALNRVMPFVHTPYTIFTDANTMLNREAIREILAPFANPRVGCVAGEKRIMVRSKDSASSGGEGFYWKYESKLKAWDSCLYSTIGAAGELYAIRTSLFQAMPEDTLLDDFILSMKIAIQGYKIAYCDKAYAIEDGSADMKNEEKRKIRIAAGGIQAAYRLRYFLFSNPFRLSTLKFQYFSHRILRWSIAPVFLFLLFPVNLILAVYPAFSPFYSFILLLQMLFYSMAFLGYLMQKKHLKIKLLFIPYYFLFMNLNVLKAFGYLRKNKGKGAWEKAKRKTVIA